MEEAVGWIVGFFIVVAAVVWLVGIVLAAVVWLVGIVLAAAYWIVASVAFVLVACFDGLTSASAAPSAPAVMWALWGGLIGGALGFWTIAPVYGLRRFRPLIVMAPFVLMLGFSAIRAMVSHAIPQAATGTPLPSAPPFRAVTSPTPDRKPQSRASMNRAVRRARSRSVYLSDLKWSFAESGWGSVEKDRSNGEIDSGDGRVITLNGKTYRKGLGCHADADVRYRLNGRYNVFISEVGIDDESTDAGSVVFEVWTDGRMAWSSGTMSGNSATKTARVSVSGVDELRLVVTDAGDGPNSDHADWAGARLLITD